MKPTNQRGWGLTETLLTLGAISVMALATYAVLGPASASAQVKREQTNLRHLSTAVDRSFGLLGNFAAVSTPRVVQDGLAPTRMRQGEDLRTAWGTGIGIHPYAVGQPDDAFLVTYPLAPAEVCAGLAAAMARDAFDIRVEGRTVFADGVLDPAIAAEQCGQGSVASMEFVFHSGLVSGQAVAAPPLILPPAPPSVSRPPSTPPVLAIPENPGVEDATPGTLPAPPASSASPPPAPPPLAPPAPAPAPEPVTITTPPPVPVTPPGAMCNPAPTALPNQTQRVNCPPGYLGEIHETRTRTQHYTCPEAWDNPQPSHQTFGLWSETSNTCAPECVAPAPTTATQSVDCPAGQLGEIIQEQTTTWTCPAATGSPTSTMGDWTTVSNTCAAECAAPPSTSESISRAAPVQDRDNCPADHTGSTPQRRTGTEAGTRTTSWTCPAPTGSPTSTSTDTWSGTYTYGNWTANGPDTCAAPPPTCATAPPVWVDLGSSSYGFDRHRLDPQPVPGYHPLPNGWPSNTPAAIASALISVKAEAAAQYPTVVRADPPYGYPGGGTYSLAGGSFECSAPGTAFTWYTYWVFQAGPGMGNGGDVYSHSWTETYGACMSACDAAAFNP